MNLFNRKNAEVASLPAALKPDDPVNYTSVLDYLVGLSQEEYDKMCKVTGIYRQANSDAAKVLGVTDKPTSALKPDQPSDAEVDTALDQALNTPDLDLLPSEDEPASSDPSKEQAPSKETKIDVKAN